MKLKIYQVDAFTDKVFSGNPAAVCPLDQWLSDEVMQKIANENNLSETVFFVKQEKQYQIRWFTPAVEVDLCGHATLAAAYVLFNYENHNENIINFYSHRSGVLSVTKKHDLFTLNFPADIYKETELTEELTKCFNIKPESAFRGKTDVLLVFDNEEDIRNIIPKFELIKEMNVRGIIITAKGKDVDFVSRFFAPQAGVNEDPVTGSAHTTLTPYWAKRLGKTELTAIQLSERMGFLQCTYLNDRVEISGKAKLYLIGEIFIE